MFELSEAEEPATVFGNHLCLATAEKVTTRTNRRMVFTLFTHSAVGL